MFVELFPCWINADKNSMNLFTFSPRMVLNVVQCFVLQLGLIVSDVNDDAMKQRKFLKIFCYINCPILSLNLSVASTYPADYSFKGRNLLCTLMKQTDRSKFSLFLVPEIRTDWYSFIFVFLFVCFLLFFRVWEMPSGKQRLTLPSSPCTTCGSGPSKIYMTLFDPEKKDKT